MSKIMRRTDSWRGVVFELKTKPKKEEKKWFVIYVRKR
jgi:hypothetical protein